MAQNHDTPRQKRTWRGFFLHFIGRVAILAGIAGLFAYTYFQIRDRNARTQLQKRIASLEEKQLPVGSDSLKRYAENLTSDENSSAWLQVLEELQSDDFKKSTGSVPFFNAGVPPGLPSPGQPWPEEQTTRAFVERWGSLYQKASALSQEQLEPNMVPVRFVFEFDSINTELSAASNVRSVAKLLSLRGKIAIYDHNSIEVRSNIESLLGCSRAVSGEPFLVCELVGIAIDDMALDLLRDSIKYDILTEADLIKLLPRILDAIDMGPEWRRAIIGERAMILPVFSDPSILVKKASKPIPPKYIEALQYLDEMERILAAEESDLESFRDSLIAIMNARYENSRSRMWFSRNQINFFDHLSLPLDVTVSHVISKPMMHRLGALAIGARLFEKRNGRLPADLGELPSELVNTDRLLPPGGKPFGYRVTEAGALLWGFSVQQAASTPPEPPPTGEGVRFADQNKQWIWHLEKS